MLHRPSNYNEPKGGHMLDRLLKVLVVSCSVVSAWFSWQSIKVVTQCAAITHMCEAVTLDFQVRTYHHIAKHKVPVNGCPECADIVSRRISGDGDL